MMNSRLIISHCCAVFAGIAFAFALSGRTKPAEAIKDGTGSTVKVPARRPVRDAVIRPRDLLRSLVKLPMESSERYSLKAEIYQDWSKRDPLGFLNYFEHRPWPGYIGSSSPFEILARTQPDELLAYARRTGCNEAAEVLVKLGDPYRVLEVLGVDGLARLPEDVLEDFVRRGESADPHFHERLAVITDEEARKTAFQQVANTMKDAGRLEELLSLVARYPESFEESGIGRNVATLLLQDPREMERLDAMPESLRTATAKEMISSFAHDDLSEDGQREVLAGLASRGLLEGSGMDIFETIVESGEDASPEELDAWRAWATVLPKDETTRPLRLASMAMWSYGTRAGLEQLATLPPGELRDAAVVGAVASRMENENPAEATTLAGEIGDAGLREKFLHYLKLCETGDEPDEFDPFGFQGADDLEEE